VNHRNGYNVDSHRRTPRNESIVRLQRKLATVVAMSVALIENDKFIAEFHVCIDTECCASPRSYPGSLITLHGWLRALGRCGAAAASPRSDPGSTSIIQGLEIMHAHHCMLVAASPRSDPGSLTFVQFGRARSARPTRSPTRRRRTRSSTYISVRTAVHSRACHCLSNIFNLCLFAPL
jgi:hypothetical protein